MKQLLTNLMSKFRKDPPPEFTQEEVERGYALRIKRVVGEFVHGWVTVVIQQTDLKSMRVKEKHCCIPIPDSQRYYFDMVLRGVPSASEKKWVWDYLLNHPEAHRIS